MEKEPINEVIKTPISQEDKDEAVRKALEREVEEGSFELTPGQEKTINKAAEASGEAILAEERIRRNILRQPRIARNAEAISRAILLDAREAADTQGKEE